nr:Chain C, Non-structural protein 8 [Severe acute respiratory syndrome coronavirus 2]
ALWEIQQVV